MTDAGQNGRWTRRRFSMVLPLLGALPWAARAVVADGMAVAAAPQRGRRALLGTQIDIIVDGVDSGTGQRALERAFAEMQRLEALLSRYRADSAVRQIGNAAGKHPVAVPAEVMAVLQSAQRVYRESRGAFDPTIGALAGWRFEPGQHAAPSAAELARELRRVGAEDLRLDARAGTAYLARPGMALDLGGIAKLPILDAGLRALKREGVANALINGGGDVLAMGRLSGRPWRVGVRDPRSPARLLGAIRIDGGGVVASSGDYERGFLRDGRLLHHVLDPKTGWPTTGVHGVTLFARDVEAVNGWGTALMVQGPSAAPAWSAERPGSAVLSANADGSVWQSDAMRPLLLPVAA
ncbi:FAD:protein FMN transferase [Thermomonas sp.]|uniref:FAD:protein FMN transferase n=1 Tax=Thermomonas sp. TaxID=1971895 RepID=UPI00262A1464|nr:FAD:protein FMN transferase [Thermomonas sp.]MCO5055907.1 FAD:protein FMN transferase [Thermomonas sp.]